jgi:hypothetical protein
MRAAIMTIVLAILIQVVWTESARAVEPTLPQAIAPMSKTNDGSHRVSATPVGWGVGRWSSRSAGAVRPSNANGRSNASREFWRGYYGSRTFSYGGVYARPGYAPGPP